MKTELLNLAHQSLLKAKFQKLNLFLSEYSFANLYLFRKIHKYELILLEKNYFIRGKTRDGNTFIMPTTSLDQLPKELFHSFIHQKLLFPIPDQWLSCFEKNIQEATFKEEDCDYLYQITKFLAYPGSDLEAKRNLVKQLLKSYHVRKEPLTPLLAKDAQQVLDHWQENQQTSIEQTDYYACLEAIQLLEELSLSGRLLYINDQPKGLIIGEWLTPHCYTVHFSKGSREIHGLYQYLYQELALSFKTEEGWLNLEQDLGILNLRKAKQSYHPDQLLKKWRLQLHFS